MLTLEKVKRHLRETTNDSDEYINDLIEEGKARLNREAGKSLDFDEAGQAQGLLFDYVRYAYNDVRELFFENFRGELLALCLHVGAEELKERLKDAE